MAFGPQLVPARATPVASQAFLGPNRSFWPIEVQGLAVLLAIPSSGLAWLVIYSSIARPRSDSPVFNDLDRLDTTRMRGFEWTAMEPNSETSAELITLQLAPAEVLALYSFLALGAHFAATTSGEQSPFSPNEVRGHIATIEEGASNTLTDKLARAVVVARERHREQLPKTSSEVDKV
jgi:hypothetical protein